MGSSTKDEDCGEAAQRVLGRVEKCFPFRLDMIKYVRRCPTNIDLTDMEACLKHVVVPGELVTGLKSVIMHAT